MAHTVSVWVKCGAALAAAGVLLASAGPVAAAEAGTDGRRLLTYCEELAKEEAAMNPFRAAYCMAFVEGTLRGWEAGAYFRNAPVHYCIKPGVSMNDLVRIVTTHIRENPSALAGKAEIQVINAIQRAFPCAPGKAR